MMGISTFSGPLRVGTVREGASTNLGTTVLSQTYTIPTADILTAPPTRVAFRLPAGAKITALHVEVTQALATATNCGLTVGKEGGTANLYYTSFNTGATVVRLADSVPSAAMQVVETNNIGTSDVGVTITATAATGNASAGTIQVTMEYIQR